MSCLNEISILACKICGPGCSFHSKAQKIPTEDIKLIKMVSYRANSAILALVLMQGTIVIWLTRRFTSSQQYPKPQPAPKRRPRRIAIVWGAEKSFHYQLVTLLFNGKFGNITRIKFSPHSKPRLYELLFFKAKLGVVVSRNKDEFYDDLKLQACTIRRHERKDIFVAKVSRVMKFGEQVFHLTLVSVK